jgi:hypothetical protein
MPGTGPLERMTRHGDDAPAGGVEALHRGVTDATAGTGQDEGSLLRPCRPRR